MQSMINGEFQNPMTHEVEEHHKQLQEVTRQIENIVQAIQKTGFSEALELSLRSLETRRDALRGNLEELETKFRAMAGADNLQDRVFELVGEFDAMWERASMDEKKMLLKDFLYGVRSTRTERSSAPLTTSGPSQALERKSPRPRTSYRTQGDFNHLSI